MFSPDSDNPKWPLLTLPSQIFEGHTVTIGCRMGMFPKETIFSYRLQSSDVHFVGYINIEKKRVLFLFASKKDPLLTELQMPVTLTDSSENRIKPTNDDLNLLAAAAWDLNGENGKKCEMEEFRFKVFSFGSKLHIFIESKNVVFCNVDKKVININHLKLLKSVKENEKLNCDLGLNHYTTVALECGISNLIPDLCYLGLLTTENN